MVAPIADTAHPGPHEEDWPQRAWALALLGALVALAIYQILHTGSPHRWSEDASRIALATLLSTAGIGFAFVVERGKIAGSAVFALVAGLVVASVLYWSGDFRSWEPWRLVSALLAVSIAAPLFQGHRDGLRDGGERRWAIPYVETHNRAWVNVCLWFAAWAFVGIVFLLSWLLAALFKLIGIGLLEGLLREGWFWMMLAGAAFGGAVGMLRDKERIVGTVQKVVMIVLSALAPVLAAGLTIFLAALLFTGLDTLWESTKATTPILLSCIIGALILANAILKDRVEDESTLVPLRWSALALCVSILPLGAIALVSTHLRIGQYGYTPDRLWALTFTLIACVYGLAYLVAVLRGRRGGWTGHIRAMNLALALGLCGLAFLLSTPLISFGAISARDQVARLESGTVKPEQFDYAAMRFDYGPAGVEGLKRLAKEGKTADIRTAAANAMKATNRYAVIEDQRKAEDASNIVVYPKGAVLPAALRERLTEYDACMGQKPCNVIFRPDTDEALVVRSYNTQRIVKGKGDWNQSNAETASKAIEVAATKDSEIKSRNAAFAAGKVEIRTVQQRQVFIDGKPVGQPFE